MKIFVVIREYYIYYDYQDTAYEKEIIGVLSSFEKAKDFVKKSREKYPSSYFEIEQHEVIDSDKENDV